MKNNVKKAMKMAIALCMVAVMLLGTPSNALAAGYTKSYTKTVTEYSRKVDGRIKIQGRLSGKFGGKVNEIAACPILRRKTSMEGMTLKPPLWQVLKLGAP